MTVLTPVIFSALSLVADSLAAGDDFWVQPSEGRTIQMIVPVDTVDLGSTDLVDYDVIASDGGSRRVIITTAIEGPTDIIDGGSWGEEGFIDSFYFTDRKRDSMTAWFNVADASPQVSEAPEGWTMIEFTDRISLIVMNHDTAEQETFVLRDNQVTYKIGDDGKFILQSIRPKPDDMSGVVKYLRIYDLTREDSDTPLTEPEFRKRIREMFPVPGRFNTIP